MTNEKDMEQPNINTYEQDSSVNSSGEDITQAYDDFEKEETSEQEVDKSNSSGVFTPSNQSGAPKANTHEAYSGTETTQGNQSYSANQQNVRTDTAGTPAVNWDRLQKNVSNEAQKQAREVILQQTPDLHIDDIWQGVDPDTGEVRNIEDKNPLTGKPFESASEVKEFLNDFYYPRRERAFKEKANELAQQLVSGNQAQINALSALDKYGKELKGNRAFAEIFNELSSDYVVRDSSGNPVGYSQPLDTVYAQSRRIFERQGGSATTNQGQGIQARREQSRPHVGMPTNSTGSHSVDNNLQEDMDVIFKNIEKKLKKDPSGNSLAL
jgi:hypothetical protein